MTRRNGGWLDLGALILVNLLWATQYPAYAIAGAAMEPAALNFWTLLAALLLAACGQAQPPASSAPTTASATQPAAETGSAPTAASATQPGHVRLRQPEESLLAKLTPGDLAQERPDRKPIADPLNESDLD